jgi:thiamine biosynthesis protein ThiS
MITLTVNGRAQTLECEIGLVEYLQRTGVDTRLVAVAVNGEVIPKRDYAQVRLREGDTVEIVRMVGGG